MAWTKVTCAGKSKALNADNGFLQNSETNREIAWQTTCANMWIAMHLLERI